jgi:hypothetical protein
MGATAVMNKPVPQTSPFAQVAIQLIANGYHPIPIMPGDKAPGELRGGSWRLMNDWPKYRDQKPAEFILRLWSSWDSGNVSIVTGTRVTQTHEIAAIDFDTDQSELLETMESSIPPSPVRKRGRRGYTGFYLAPIGTRGRKFKKGPNVICEILTGTNTRQTVIPPSIHPNTGKPYVWMSDRTLLNTPATALPVLTEDMLERFVDTVEFLEGVEEVATRSIDAKPRSDGEATVWGAVNNKALANLDAWVPQLPLPKLKRSSAGYQAVAWWRPSSSGRPLDQRATNLGISSAGIKDFGTDDTYTALDLTMRATNWDLDTAFAWLSRQLGMSEDWGDIIVPEIVEEQAEAIPHDPETGEIIEASSLLDDELPESLTRVPGLLGELVDWITASSVKPIRALQLGPALVTMSALLGNVVAGPTRSGTHLYVAGLAPSGAGKDHGLKMVKIILDQVGAKECAAAWFKSETAIQHLIERRPVLACAVDELGLRLKPIFGKQAKGFESGIGSMLMTLWSCNPFTGAMSDEWAGVEAHEIPPCSVSIYGVSTEQAFFAGLSGDQVVNGFLNRWLLIRTGQRMLEAEGARSDYEMPASLRDRLAAMRMGLLQTSATTDPFAARPVRIAEWGAGAKALDRAFQEHLFKIEADPETGIFYSRTREMALRLATLRGVGIDWKRPIVRESDLQWGQDLAMWSAMLMKRQAMEHIVENERAGYVQRLVALLRRRDDWISPRDFQQQIRSALPSKDIKVMLDELVDMGMAERETPKIIIGEKGGRPSDARYRITPKGRAG